MVVLSGTLRADVVVTLIVERLMMLPLTIQWEVWWLVVPSLIPPVQCPSRRRAQRVHDPYKYNIPCAKNSGLKASMYVGK